MVDKDVPLGLQGKQLYELDLASLVAELNLEVNLKKD